MQRDGLEIVQTVVIPALDEVGKGFEEKRIYLPQLLMSAEAAKSAFEKIKAAAEKKESAGGKDSFPVVLATVKGDVHDIGKNIVRLLLENYDIMLSTSEKMLTSKPLLTLFSKAAQSLPDSARS